ncbi:hypothetical protein WA171_005965 [Blastocystis sp. BT1]
MNHFEGNENEVSTGTTIMAIRLKDCVVMGADSRSSAGVYVANRVTDKIEQIDDRIFMCRSGSAADTQKIGRLIRSQLEQFRTMYGYEPIVRNAATLAHTIIYKYKDQLQAGIIVAGVDDVDGASIYEVTLGGSMLKQDVCLGGSGSTYIYGYVDSNYNPNMTPEEGEEFVRRAIQLAISRDGHSGGVVRTAIIRKEGVTRKVLTEKDFLYAN